MHQERTIEETFSVAKQSYDQCTMKVNSCYNCSSCRLTFKVLICMYILLCILSSKFLRTQLLANITRDSACFAILKPG